MHNDLAFVSSIGCYLLQLVMVNNVLVSRAALQERVQPVHVMHIPPQMHQCLRDLEVSKVLAGDPDVLQPRHQFAIETAHRVAGEEARSFAAQMLVNFAQVCHQRRRFWIFVLVLRVQQ